MLAKDKSTFDSMFGLEAHTMSIDVDDQDDNKTRAQVEGETDDIPIRLHGDTVEEFSALLWSLYALYVLLGVFPCTHRQSFAQTCRNHNGNNNRSKRSKAYSSRAHRTQVSIQND
jgi:hypothetical protein